jgi:predicted AAA+ superfamily ATPase
MIQADTLKEVILSQKESMKNLNQGIEREKEIAITNSFASIITGVRRCGKSTFLNQLLKKEPNFYYLNLEDPRLDGFELSDFNKIENIMKELFGEGGIYFLDEIQNIEKWEKFVRYLIDKKEKVVLTGSNASLLSMELGTKLTGRNIQTEMFPFSFREFLVLKKEEPSEETFLEYMQKGGFPEYLLKENPQILNSLLSDIVMKDIALRFGIKNTTVLNKIALYLISNVGKEFSYNSIKKMFEIKSVQSVIDYISYFENAYLIFTVPMFSYSYKKQQVNPKKVYSIDNGFSSVNSISFSSDKGRMLENLVFLELRRKFKDIFYFQDGKECDFLIKEKDKITQAVQVCLNFNEETKEREISGLLKAVDEFNLKTGLILTFSQEDEFIINNKKIILKPTWKWMIEDRWLFLFH